MSIINISNLTFCYDGSCDNVFENVNLRLDTDWRLGLVGRNGQGKTTLLNLLQGSLHGSGKIEMSVWSEYFPYEVDVETSPYDMFSDMNCGQLWQLKRELNLLKVSDDVLYRPLSSLSYGERTKVMLAMLFLKENVFLLIDEPTNHLDLLGRQQLAEYLNSKSGFIVVSHDRAFLDSCVDHIVSINNTNIDVHSGNFSTYLENKRLRDEFEEKENQRLKKDIGRLKVAAEQARDWSDKVEDSKIGNGPCDRGYIGHKAAKMMKRSKAIENRIDTAIEEKSALLKNIDRMDKLKVSSSKNVAKRLLEIRDLSICYGSKKVINNISFEINDGDRVAIVGANGSGKSSIFKAILGESEYSGIIRRAPNLHISYIPQSCEGINGSIASYCERSKIDKTLLITLLHKLGLEPQQFEKELESYSEGQKKKVLIAASLISGAQLFMFDEPLNFVDIISRMQIIQLLESCNITMLFIEHDEYFCDVIATKKITLQSI